MKQPKKIWTLFVIGLMLMLSCDNIDCTLNNTVNMNCGFYSSGNAVELSDMLTVTALGTDSILINREVGAEEMILPLSYWNPVDSIVLKIEGEGYLFTDTLYIEKSNTPHFESPDCPSTMFHQIISARHSRNFIDSITIVKSSVDYEQLENIQIHL